MDRDIQRKYNLKSPAVKRLMREAMELREPTEQYFAQPLEDNLFEWHFTVRGPPDSEFQNGIYHGRITLPPEYPMKPPSIMLLTPNGRFETGKKICLSMSAHHPETWQPSWSIRTVLLAIIGFMPTKGGGAIGALDYTPKERKILANRSLEWKCDVCGVPNKTNLLEVDHSKDEQVKKEAQEIAAQMSFKGEQEKTKDQASTQAQQTSTTPNRFNFNQDPNNPQFPPHTNPYMNMYNPYNSMYNMPQVLPPGFPPNVGSNVPNLYTGTPAQEVGSKDDNDIIGQDINPDQDKSIVTDKNEAARPSQENNGNTGINQQPGNSISSELRERKPANLSQNASSNASSSSGRTRPAPRQSDPGYCSLVLLWVVAAALVVLVLRRLCMDTVSIPQG